MSSWETERANRTVVLTKRPGPATMETLVLSVKSGGIHISRSARDEGYIPRSAYPDLVNLMLDEMSDDEARRTLLEAGFRRLSK